MVKSRGGEEKEEIGKFGYRSNNQGVGFKTDNMMSKMKFWRGIPTDHEDIYDDDGRKRANSLHLWDIAGGEVTQVYKGRHQIEVGFRHWYCLLVRWLMSSGCQWSHWRCQWGQHSLQQSSLCIRARINLHIPNMVWGLDLEGNFTHGQHGSRRIRSGVLGESCTYSFEDW